MAEARIAERSPAILELKPGEYWWCRCGLSKIQPWCDSSHKFTEFRPMQVNVTEKKRYAMFRCKHSGTMPFCDGTHRKLPAES